MSRTFGYSFKPAASDPLCGDDWVELTIAEIEDAGIREVLQTPGASYGTWSFLDALLTQGNPFMFKEELGHAREVKVALSGLFGRFVARAYLERYFKLRFFAHVGQKMVLNAQRQIRIVRTGLGDLPDWLACGAGVSTLTVAEAKGSHDPSGPEKALQRAWDQAGRIDVMVANKRASVKRIAMATRWAAQGSGLGPARIAVQDPDDEGDPLTPDEQDAVFIGLVRFHIANLMVPLGYEELAEALRGLAVSAGDLGGDIARARGLFDKAPIREIEGDGAIDGLVGGAVTRAGRLGGRQSLVDQETLWRLGLRPTFVGIERELVRAAIEGEETSVRRVLDAARGESVAARYDGAGGWVVPLGAERIFLKER